MNKIDSNEIIKKRRKAVDLGYVDPNEKVKDCLSRIKKLKNLAQDTTDPYGFISLNAIGALENLKGNIPGRWRKIVVGFLTWWKKKKKALNNGAF